MNMNLMKIIKAATLGEPKKVRSMILWTILEYFFRGAPYGILIMAIWELFKPLQNPGTQLNLTNLIICCVGLLIALIILFIVSRKAYFEQYYSTYDICADGRLKIGEHLRKLSMGFYNSNDPGNIGSYLITDYANIEFVLTHLLPQMIGSIVMPTFLIIILTILNWKLGLVSLAVIPLALPFSYLSKWFIKHFGKKHQKAKIDAESRMIEYLQGIKLIKAFNLRGTRFERLRKAFSKLKSLSIKLEGGGGPTVILSGVILHGGITVIILVGLILLLGAEISIPFYIMFLIIGQRIYEPFIQVLIFSADLNYYELSLNRLENLLKAPVLTGTNPEIKPEKMNIEFKNVTFRYHNTNVIKNVSLNIPEHSLVALVGPSGSGKTTMTRLIARFWDVSDGQILLDGNDIRMYNPDDLLNSISMVFQEVYLFNDSVYNNIVVGKKDVTMDEVIEIAKKARCHEFIEKLPDKYNTIIGEGGSTLSGGEKQRISIARAILKNAPIILLDEATASLDPENELYIQQAINDLVKNKTVVVIAHRLNTVVDADKIVVLDKGMIVEEGTHKELLNGNGLYNIMWEEQRKTRKWKFGAKETDKIK